MTSSSSIPSGSNEKGKPALDRAKPFDDGAHEVWLQREDVGPLRSFKWRGALAHCEELAGIGAPGVVAASTGNFAAAVAWAAERCGLRSRVVVPQEVSAAKLATLRQLGADVVLHGEALPEAVGMAKRIAASSGLPYFEDGGSAAQIKGIGQLGVELARHAPDVVVAPVGVGALAAGVASGLRQAGCDARVIGVQTRPCSRLAARFHGQPDPPFRPADTIADGLADDRLVDPAFGTCLELLDDVLILEEQTIRSAVRTMHKGTGLLVEGAAAAPLAALIAVPDRLPPGKIALIVSGANISPELARELLNGAEDSGVMTGRD